MDLRKILDDSLTSVNDELLALFRDRLVRDDLAKAAHVRATHLLATKSWMLSSLLFRKTRQEVQVVPVVPVVSVRVRLTSRDLF